MITTITECNGCETCINCGLKSCKIVICDKCRLPETCYHFDDKHFCIDCIENMLDEVDANED